MTLEGERVIIKMTDGTTYFVPVSQVACEVAVGAGLNEIAGDEAKATTPRKRRRAAVVDDAGASPANLNYAG